MPGETYPFDEGVYEASPGLATFGDTAWDTVEALNKALSAGAGTDISTLTGGRALTLESLENVLMTTCYSAKDLVLFPRLKRQSIGAVTDSWVEKSERGQRGVAFADEDAAAVETSAIYNRRVGIVKFLSTMRTINLAKLLEANVMDVEAEEQLDGTLILLRDAEWALFEGDSSVVTQQFDGLAKIVADNGDAENYVDVGGATLTMEHLVEAAQVIRNRFGNPTELYLSTSVQTDLDQLTPPAHRVAVPGVGEGGVGWGAPISKLRTSFGTFQCNPNIFIVESAAPVGALASDPTPPISHAGAAASTGTIPAGTYEYRVSSVNKNGESTTVLIDAGVAVNGSQKVTLTIARSGTIDETGYYVYRGRKDVSTPADADVRFIGKVGYAGATTPFVDDGSVIPGTSKAFLLSQDPTLMAVDWRQLAPMMKFNLYPSTKAVKPWLQLLFGYLRVTKPKMHVVLKNIMPTNQSWTPF